MDFTGNLIINMYSIVILAIIYIHSIKHNEKDSLQYKLYMMMLQVTILMLALDIFSRFDGKLGKIYFFINHFGNFSIFLLNLILPSLWLLYVHLHVYQEERKTRRLFYPLLIINAINGIMLIFSQFFGWFYYIDANNIYHRGPVFLVPVFITFGLILVAFIITVKKRKNLEGKSFVSLAFFAVPPFACIILQIIFYGISLMLNSVVLSLLVIFLNIQNYSIYTDYLTGINNRKKLDLYLKEKVNTSTENKSFSAILIDLNNFKSINDTFGHDIGDNALEISVRLLKSCLRSKDFIARYGGDEFCIVLDVSDRTDLEEVVRRINNCFEEYNKSSSKHYKLSVSMGYDVYDYHSHMKINGCMRTKG